MPDIHLFYLSEAEKAIKHCKVTMFTNVKKSVENVKKSSFLFFHRIITISFDKYFTCIRFFLSFLTKIKPDEYSSEYSSGKPVKNL